MSWLMFPGGIVMPSRRPVHKMNADDPRTIQVRARRREHIARFRRDYCPKLGPTVELPKTDYEFRAYCTPEQLALAFQQIALDCENYVKFKPETENQYDDKELHELYNSIWSVVIGKLGDDGRWPKYWGSGTTYSGSGAYDWTGQGTQTWRRDPKTGDWEPMPSIEGGTFIGADEPVGEVRTVDDLYYAVVSLPITTKSEQFGELTDLLNDIERLQKPDHDRCEHQATRMGDDWCEEGQFETLRARFEALEEQWRSAEAATAAQ
jgi:hypothetical protein